MSEVEARQALRVFVDGEEVPGFIVYGLAPLGHLATHVELRFPPGLQQVGHYRLTGQRWEVQLCEVHVSTWPVSAAWAEALRASLGQMRTQGAVLAWIGAEGLPYADPPDLFSAEFMHGGVLVWTGPGGATGGSLELDGPLQPVGDEELARIRSIGRGLADAD
jgi:hypothetical protein